MDEMQDLKKLPVISIKENFFFFYDFFHFPFEYVFYSLMLTNSRAHFSHVKTSCHMQEEKKWTWILDMEFNQYTYKDTERIQAYTKKALCQENGLYIHTYILKEKIIGHTHKKEIESNWPRWTWDTP